MANNSMPIERLQALDNVEKEIAGCIQSAGIRNHVCHDTLFSFYWIFI